MSMMEHNTVGATVLGRPQNTPDDAGNHRNPVGANSVRPRDIGNVENTQDNVGNYCNIVGATVPGRPQNARDNGDNTTRDAQGRVPYADIPKGTPLLLHSCCGPCSVGVIAELQTHFTLYVSFYNPNILPLEEYERRLDAQKTVLDVAKTAYPITFFEGAYTPEVFLETATGLEQEPEGGKRCEHCFHLRLEHSAKLAKANNIPHFATTLSISPHKNADVINRLGKTLGEEYRLHFLAVDFKKNGGFQESVRLSKELGIYRQNYCGCGF